MLARDTILKRRALFVASALSGLAVRDAHAQDAEAHEQQPPLPPPTPDPRPYACLIPPQPPDRPDHNGIDLAVGCAPSVLAPAFTNGAVGFASPFQLGLRRDLTESFDVSLFATVMPSHSRGTFAPIGGVLRLGTRLITPHEWDPPYQLFNTLDVGGGAWLAPERSGPNAEEPVPTRGAFVSVGATLLGFRHSWDRTYFGRSGHWPTYSRRIDVSIPLALFFTTQQGGGEERFGPSWFMIGLNVTFYLQLKEPTADVDHRTAAR